MKKGNIYRVWFTDELGEDCYLVAEFRSEIILTHCKPILSQEAKLRGLKLDIRVMVVADVKSSIQ
tara:strand:- start:6 stop:200 length:195 start_codon:yes stop_codon:yes gene_type:complete